MSSVVEPRISRGLRDLLPEQMLARQQIIETIRGVYELYGFVPISTPAIEYLEILSGSAGPDGGHEQFHVSNPEGEALGLRFDLTVPLARVVAQYPELPRPFRRYQVAPVWRTDKPDKGRYREFTQFDLDSVGTESEIADTEILAGVCDALSALKVDRYLVRYSSRAVLNLLLDHSGIAPERAADTFRVLDKLDKIGIEKVRLELTEGYRDESGDTIRGVQLTKEQVASIERFLAIQSSSRGDVLARVRELFGSPPAVEAISKISDHLYALGYGDDRVAIDLSIARGLAYYTGPVFEATLLDAPQFGAVFGGGRYDGLVARFLGERIPAVGASVGVDRLLAALTHLGAIHSRKATSRVLVTQLDATLADEYVQITWELRRAGIPAELYIGTAKGLAKQLKYANQCEIPLAIVIGSDERARGVVTLKNMQAGRDKAKEVGDRRSWLAERSGQTSVPRSELVDCVRKLLAEM